VRGVKFKNIREMAVVSCPRHPCSQRPLCKGKWATASRIRPRSLNVFYEISVCSSFRFIDCQTCPPRSAPSEEHRKTREINPALLEDPVLPSFSRRALALHCHVFRAQVGIPELLEKSQRGNLADRGFLEGRGHEKMVKKVAIGRVRGFLEL